MSNLPSTTGNERFNAEAANWDNNPSVQEATRLAYETLQPLIQKLSDEKKSTLDVLEVGCGTGLLSVRVAPLVHEIVAVDTAEGMIEMLKRKTTQPDTPKNILPICKLLEDPEDPALPPSGEQNPAGARRKFDLALSHLVLHHIPDLRPFLRMLLGCLKPGGRIALTDFEDFGPEAIKFHPPSKLEGVERHGIPRQWMEDLLKEAGFVQVKVWVGWKLEKDIGEWEENAGSNGDVEKKTMQFPFLVCEGVRP
ncbi:class I SAM-dependent methyltransferase [Aspergillus alliaceus]|uniref:class I SAM-dependent methyltransferase n=1 Tax=Petromyces alliaceus TaxID=209559 RepID=UPI0012A5E7B1|nr:S-adenosyl-L-methionine-dependent methyltransferase [Aspergillus alliaceus]KAB8238236.1 S-adenosyl-L-methionine-dependent methyltransferase [Aspergillus alliaceus]